MALSKNQPSQSALPGTFLAMSFSSGAESFTTYGEISQAQGATLHVKCLSPMDFDGISKGKTLRVRFPFALDSPPREAALVEHTDLGVVIRLQGEGREPSRRILLRGGTVLPIQVLLQAGRIVEGRTGNVSAGGAMVVLSKLPEVDAEVLFRLALPDDPSAVLEGQARVAWARTVAGEHQVGLTFIALETPEIRRLCRLAFRAAARSKATE
ncbi:MAG: PilZ domain-containing protein [Myxococcota bacterium]|nr:PilZ domain-containing protein [Myxococcota bacterium]